MSPGRFSTGFPVPRVPDGPAFDGRASTRARSPSAPRGRSVARLAFRCAAPVRRGLSPAAVRCCWRSADRAGSASFRRAKSCGAGGVIAAVPSAGGPHRGSSSRIAKVDPAKAWSLASMDYGPWAAVRLERRSFVSMIGNMTKVRTPAWHRAYVTEGVLHYLRRARRQSGRVISTRTSAAAAPAAASSRGSSVRSPTERRSTGPPSGFGPTPATASCSRASGVFRRRGRAGRASAGASSPASLPAPLGPTGRWCRGCSRRPRTLSASVDAPSASAGFLAAVLRFAVGLRLQLLQASNQPSGRHAWCVSLFGESFEHGDIAVSVFQPPPQLRDFLVRAGSY